MSTLTKEALRLAARTIVAGHSPAAFAAAGHAIVPTVVACIREALRGPHVGATVALFASRPDELDTSPLAQAVADAGWQRALPVFSRSTMHFVEVAATATWAELPRDRMQIPTPASDAPLVPFDRIAVVIVPGLAFDRAGHRLGRGRGLYDRALTLMPQALRLAVCLDAQLVDAVPVEAHDVRMQAIATPGGGVLRVA